MGNLTARFEALTPEIQSWLIELAQVDTSSYRLKRKGKKHVVRNIADVPVKAVPIMLAVCKTLKLSAARLKSPERTHVFVKGRFMSYNLLAENGYKLKAIGGLFNRDHSTVLYGLDVHADLVFSNASYRSEYQQICEALTHLPRRN